MLFLADQQMSIVLLGISERMRWQTRETLRSGSFMSFPLMPYLSKNRSA